MFTWICPRCGREVPPSYTDCPNCGKAEQASAAGNAAPVAPAYAPPAAAPPPAAPVASQPSFLDLVQEPSSAPPQPVQSRPAAPAYQAPAPPAYQPPPPPAYQAPPPPPQHDSAPRPPSATAPASFLGLGQAAPPQQPSAPTAYQADAPMPGMPARRRLPVWLLTVVFAALFVGLVGGVYWLVDGGSATNAKPAGGVASVPAAAAPGAAPNPYQKYIEVSGVRFLEGDKKKVQVKFVVTNHSGADITGLGGSVTVLGHGPKSEVQAAGSFEFTTSVGPWESKDLTVPLVTQLEMIELPDWQNVSTNVQITSPAQ